MTSISRTLVDDAACGGCNTGQCVYPTVSVDASNPMHPITSTLGTNPHCNCKGTGFIGMHCDISCSKQCQNGGKCLPATESPYGVESCSCSKAVVDGNPFAGLDCEYGATISCMTLGGESKHSFCTNGGECADIVTDNEQHADCICMEGFEGSHCEYIEGTAPTAIVEGEGIIAGAKGGSLAETQSQDNTALDTVVLAFIGVIGALIAVLLIAFFVRAKRRKEEAKQRQKEVRAATEDLSMIPSGNNVDSENEII